LMSNNHTSLLFLYPPARLERKVIFQLWLVSASKLLESPMFFNYTRDKSFDSLCVKQAYVYCFYDCFICDTYIGEKKKSVSLAFFWLIIVTDIWQRSSSFVLILCIRTVLCVLLPTNLKGKNRVVHEHGFY
jgi:hypothetical protein